MELQTRINLRGTMVTLEVGEYFVVSCDDFSGQYLRSSASNLGFDKNRKFKVNLDREARTFTVTRTE